MTAATASAVVPIAYNHNNELLINAILKLSDDEFYKLVSIRLNLPISLSQEQVRQSGITEPELEGCDSWTEERLIDEIFLHLAETKQQTITQDGKQITIPKYYRQAENLKNKIPIYRPTPKFIINISDLNTRLIAELQTIENPEYVLKQAVGQIFANIDSRQYHLSIARKLKVELQQ